MALASGRKILEELLYAAKEKQLPPYRTTEVAQIEQEIKQRHGAIKEVLEMHQKDLKEYIEKEGEVESDIADEAQFFDFPSVILWFHISTIQQLERSIAIYRHQRHRWLCRFAMDCARLGCDPPDSLVKRLSQEEHDMLKRVVADESLPPVARGLPLEPCDEDCEPIRRSLTVKHMLPGKISLAAELGKENEVENDYAQVGKCDFGEVERLMEYVRERKREKRQTRKQQKESKKEDGVLEKRNQEDKNNMTTELIQQNEGSN